MASCEVSVKKLYIVFVWQYEILQISVLIRADYFQYLSQLIKCGQFNKTAKSSLSLRDIIKTLR